MRVSREKAAENRERIVEAASRLFRDKGFNGVGLDEIAQAAGLTHGGFYRHFGSKSDLAAEALAHDDTDHAAGQAAAPTLGNFVTGYLSQSHRDDRATGCVVAALGGEAVRQPGAVRHAFTARVRGMIAHIAGLLDSQGAAQRRQAIATTAALAGALVLARAVDDPDLSDEILAATRAWLQAGGSKAA
jgi:TetR/AcrR family transcriptional repressor of nem operon